MSTERSIRYDAGRVEIVVRNLTGSRLVYVVDKHPTPTQGSLLAATSPAGCEAVAEAFHKAAEMLRTLASQDPK